MFTFESRGLTPLTHTTLLRLSECFMDACSTVLLQSMKVYG